MSEADSNGYICAEQAFASGDRHVVLPGFLSSRGRSGKAF